MNDEIERAIRTLMALQQRSRRQRAQTASTRAGNAYLDVTRHLDGAVRCLRQATFSVQEAETAEHAPRIPGMPY